MTKRTGLAHFKDRFFEHFILAWSICKWLTFRNLKNHSTGFDDDGVDCGRQGRGQEPRVRLEEGLVLGRLVHERDDDNPEQDDRKNCTQNKAELKRNCLRR